MDDCHALLNSYALELSKNRCKSVTVRYKMTLLGKYTQYLHENYGIDVCHATHKEVIAWLQSRNHLRPRSYNNELGILKAFWRYLREVHDYHLDVAAYKNKSVQKMLPRNIAQDRMMTLCTPHERETVHTLTALRDQAIIEYLFSTGVRSVELRTARLAHLSENLEECHIVTAKGGKNRTVYLGKPAREALGAYLARRCMKRINKQDWLFVSRTGKQLDVCAVTRLVKRISLRRLGYEVTPHMCRHTFATEMLRATGCLRSVQIMLGHSRLRNTAIYCALDFSDHCDAMSRFHPHGSAYQPGNIDIEEED